MTSLLIVRHGQTEWNRVERFRGRANLELNETGQRQAEATAARLLQWPVTAVYSSPLRRAWQTAQVIAQPLGQEVSPLEGLIDVDFGQWQGLSPQEAEQQFPSLFEIWLHHPQDLCFPGGEKLADVQARAMAAVAAVQDRHPLDTLVLVSHRVVCKLLVLGLLGLDASHYWKVEQDTCAINFFDSRDGRLFAAFLNDTCHLKNL